MQYPSHHVSRYTHTRMKPPRQHLAGAATNSSGELSAGTPATRPLTAAARGKLHLPYRRSRCDDPTARSGVVMTVIQEPTYNNRAHNCLLLNGLFVPYILRTGKAIVCTTTTLIPPLTPFICHPFPVTSDFEPYGKFHISYPLERRW